MVNHRKAARHSVAQRKAVAAKTGKRAPSSLTAATRGQIDSVQRIYKSIPVDDITEALEMSPDPRLQKLLLIMQDKQYDRLTFALKCRNAQVNPTDVWQAVMQLNELDGKMRVSRRVPLMLESIADEALPRVSECPSPGCQQGKIIKPNPKGGDPVVTDCPKCYGQGQVLLEGSTEARKMSLEVLGMLGQKGPMVDARQVHLTQNNVQLPDLSDWTRSTDDVFEERGQFRRPQIPAPKPQPAATTAPHFEEAQIIEE